MKTQELVTIIPWTFIAQILNLFIQIYFIKRFLFKPVHEILQKRQEKADAELKSARQAREEAETMKSEYESSMASARQEAAGIIDRAEKDAESRADKMIREAEAQAAAMKAKAESDIQQEKKKALNEVKDQIGGLVMDIAGKVVEKEISEEDHARLISEFIENAEVAS